jgi:hypothetical protein
VVLVVFLMLVAMFVTTTSAAANTPPLGSLTSTVMFPNSDWACNVMGESPANSNTMPNVFCARRMNPPELNKQNSPIEAPATRVRDPQPVPLNQFDEE